MTTVWEVKKFFLTLNLKGPPEIRVISCKKTKSLALMEGRSLAHICTKYPTNDASSNPARDNDIFSLFSAVSD